MHTLPSCLAAQLPPLHLPRFVRSTQRTAIFDLSPLAQYNRSSGRLYSVAMRVIPTAIVSHGAYRVFSIASLTPRLVRVPNLLPNTTYFVQWGLSGKRSPLEWRQSKPFTTLSYCEFPSLDLSISGVVM